jgi:hypothetical protein
MRFGPAERRYVEIKGSYAENDVLLGGLYKIRTVKRAGGPYLEYATYEIQPQYSDRNKIEVFIRIWAWEDVMECGAFDAGLFSDEAMDKAQAWGRKITQNYVKAFRRDGFDGAEQYTYQLEEQLEDGDKIPM